MLVATEKLAYYIPAIPHVITTKIKWIPNLPAIDQPPSRSNRPSNKKSKKLKKSTCKIKIPVVY